jgi:hypothetical protein
MAELLNLTKAISIERLAISNMCEIETLILRKKIISEEIKKMRGKGRNGSV